MNPKTKRIVLAVTLVVVVIGYALLLWRGPWWIDGAHLRTKNLQPADGVVITGFRTMLVALGAGAVAALGLHYTHRSHRQLRSCMNTAKSNSRMPERRTEGRPNSPAKAKSLSGTLRRSSFCRHQVTTA
ncbi:hypothetical protein ABZ471_31455 [Streptomyces sp. NPDC005728]|uniref:hypothetical protein n=1 Tax=Streptomyces sp. NPDC005728 TaxID=3157054 RepID=UPI0033EA6889